MMISIIFIILLFCLYFIFKFEKADISSIIKDQYKTMIDNENDTTSYSDVFVVFVIPFILSGILIIFVTITKDQINLMLTVFSIFTGLLFNLLLLVFDISQKENTIKSKIKKELLRQIFSNISFSILISIVIIILTLICSINISNLISVNIYLLLKKIATLLIYSLIGIFIFSLIMILKRVHKLLSKEF